MKKLLLIGPAIAMMVAGVAYAGPVIADVVHHASALGWGSGLSLLGMALNIATQPTATSTTFQTPATNVAQTALAAAVTGTGTQDNALLTGATGAGVVIKYQTAIIPFAVPATTCAQNTSSVTTNVQPGWQFLSATSGSVYAANKPTMQAGLGIAGLTCATTGIINVNYLNISGAAVTPTGEANDVMEFRAGPLNTTSVLSPAAVPANTTTEQIFTIVPGAGQPTICLPGTVAIVNKPTNQAGLGYSVFARVVAINQVGVTFGVVTSGAVTTGVTPTAAETYSFAFLPQLNAYSPNLTYGIPSGATAIGNSTTLEQTSGVTGIYLSDMVTGISRASSAAAGQFVAGGRVSTGLPGSVTSAIYLNYGAVVTSATPTTSEVVLASILRQAPLNPMMIYNQAVNATTCAATTTVEATTTVNGLVVSSSVLVNKPSLTPGIMVVGARVSAANTLAITYANLTALSVNIPSEVYTIGNIQLQGPGLGLTTTAGLFVAQSYYPSLQQSVTLANALRAALIAADAVMLVGASTTS